mmetsp:Transcript_38086/g.62510  ORF Transcript_38086/g.62510 Transcript_38086/m.62510 type:complete len:207 (-) Transcript_38086:161-781(-)
MISIDIHSLYIFHLFMAHRTLCAWSFFHIFAALFAKHHMHAWENTTLFRSLLALNAHASTTIIFAFLEVINIILRQLQLLQCFIIRATVNILLFEIRIQCLRLCACNHLVSDNTAQIFHTFLQRSHCGAFSQFLLQLFNLLFLLLYFSMIFFQLFNVFRLLWCQFLLFHALLFAFLVFFVPFSLAKKHIIGDELHVVSGRRDQCRL